MSKYQVLSPIKIGKQIHREGLVDLPAHQGDPLVARGVLAATEAPPSPAETEAVEAAPAPVSKPAKKAK